jgi:glycosyltransferase involved in cell wall biosynthesis
MSQLQEKPKITVVIPAYNEADSITEVITDIKDNAAEYVEHILVIDDASQDDTAELAEKAGAEVIRHKQNRGYGAALKTGIKAAPTKLILTFDADGQHDAKYIAKFWELIDDNDMVVGQRTQLIHSPLWRMPGKWLLTRMAKFLTQTHIPDLNSGLRLVDKEVVKKYIHLCPSGFSFSTTITVALISRGYQVAYTPIEVQKRASGKGTVSLSTGLNTIILILRLATLFNPLRIFLPVSFIIGGIGVLWGGPYAILGRGISIGAMLAIVVAILLFALGLISDQISALRLERFE